VITFQQRERAHARFVKRETTAQKETQSAKARRTEREQRSLARTSESREKAKRGTIFEKRKADIARTTIAESERRTTSAQRHEQRLGEIQSRRTARELVIQKKAAQQSEIETGRMQRRLAYNELSASRRGRQTTIGEQGDNKVLAGASKPAGSVVGVIFRIFVAIVGLSILLLVVSHANESSTTIGKFGNILYGLTAPTSLFQKNNTGGKKP
jgi:hypothetical protein